MKSAWELARGAELPARKPATLTGRAWSGTSAIDRVEVSADQGASWQRARLEGPRRAGTWTPFRHQFRHLERGPAELWARATDRQGRTQPLTTPFNNNGYLFNAVIRHPVTVG